MDRAKIEQCIESMQWKAHGKGYLRTATSKAYDEWIKNVKINLKTGDPLNWESFNDAPVDGMFMDDSQHDHEELHNADEMYEESEVDTVHPQWTHFLALPIPSIDKVVNSHEQFLEALMMVSPKSDKGDVLDWSSDCVRKMIQPVNRLHITILMLSIKDEDNNDTEKVVNAIRNGIDQFKTKEQQKLEEFVIEMNGLSGFFDTEEYARVIYSGVTANTEKIITSLLNEVINSLNNVEYIQKDHRWLEVQHLTLKMPSEESSEAIYTAQTSHVTLLNVKKYHKKRFRIEGVKLLQHLRDKSSNTFNLQVKVDKMYLCRLKDKATDKKFGYAIDAEFPL